MPAYLYSSAFNKCICCLAILLASLGEIVAQSSEVAPFEYPVEDCFTYTYHLKTGDNGVKTVVTKTLTSFNGEVYNIGYVEDAAGRRKGFLQQVDHNAAIAFTRYTSFADRDVSFNHITQLPDGKLLLSGSTRNQSTGEKNSLLTAFNQDGILQWSTTIVKPGYEAMAASIDSAAGVPSGIFFAGYNGNSVLYGKLYNDGEIAWTRETGNIGATELVGIGARNNYEWYIAYNKLDAGIGVGGIITISPISGNVLWAQQFGSAASGKEYIFRDALFHNSTFRVATLLREGGGPFKIAMLDIRQAGPTDMDILFDVPAVTLTSTAQLAVDMQFDKVAFTKDNNSPEWYLADMRQWDYQGNAMGWCRKYTSPGLHERLVIDRCFDGGFIMANQLPGTNGEIFSQYVKTDSLGRLKNCDGTAIVLQGILQSQTPATISITGNVSPLVVQSETPLVQDHAMAYNFICKDLHCPALPAEDTCLSAFTRQYRSGALADLAIASVPLQNELVMAGYAYDIERSEYDQMEGTLSRLNNAGKIIDRKKMQFGKTTAFQKLAKLADGNFIALGYSYYQQDQSVRDTMYLTISKFSPTLQLIWHTALPVFAPGTGALDLVEGADGSLYAHFVETLGFTGNPKIYKLNAQGQLIWAKKYTIPNTCVFNNASALTQDNAFLYIMDYGICDPGNVFMKISKLTGDPVLTKGLYVNAGANNSFQGGLNLQAMGEKLVLHGRVNTSDGGKDISYILDKSGNILRSKAFSTPVNYSSAFKQKVLQNKEIVLIANRQNENYFVRLDSNLDVLRTRRTQLSGFLFYGIQEDYNGSVVATGLKSSGDPYLVSCFLTRFDYDGHMGACASDSLPLYNYTPVFVETPLTATASDIPNTLRALPYRVSSYGLQNAGLVCGQASNCDLLQLTAPAAICDTMSYTATVIRNPGCNIPVTFSYNNPGFIITERTDTTIKFKITQPGNVQLVASIFTGCTWLRDTVHISSTATNFSLGGDTSLCLNGSITLDAGPGYPSYEWNDGSVQQQLVVTTPGTYYVKVRDACNNTVADTINVIQLAVPAVNLGNDTTICNAGVIVLTAAPGFLGYQWSPNYQLTSLSNNQVSVAPLIDTFYAVRVEYAPSCFTQDSIRIRVRYSAPIYLGADSSFCAGNSLVLNAGAGFVNYAWNTGQSTQTISVPTAGTYIVSATDANGCKSTDTLIVNNVYANPVVQLGNDFSLCDGNSRTLDAGLFDTYVWNDGSINRRLTVTAPGLYHVKVTDANSCIGSDSVLLVGIWPLPAQFLPLDTAICSYGNVQVKPAGSFSSYLWSNGTLGNALNIIQPGLYWLEVKDNNGCTGRDSIKVDPKQCMTGVYVPNSFTPNNDGLNDIFRPLLFGEVEQYELQVYNRYGQRVFQTNEQIHGWDGRHLSMPQNTGAFVWICRYRFRNGVMKVEKGTVLLIR